MVGTTDELPLAQITGIGLRTVFALISQARESDAHFCERALGALLDVLQGHAPEDLAQEPADVSCRKLCSIHIGRCRNLKQHNVFKIKYL